MLRGEVDARVNQVVVVVAYSATAVLYTDFGFCSTPVHVHF